MKRIIRLTESDLARIVKRVIKENEEEWIAQSQDIEGESDFFKMKKLKSNKDFQKLVDFFKKNPDAAKDIKKTLKMSVNESYKYYDYGDNKKEITRKHYLKRKLATYGISTLFSGILGYMMGTMAGDEILQAALLMAGMGGFTLGSLASEVGREKVDDEDNNKQLSEMYEDEYTADDAIAELEDYVYSNTQLGKNQLLSDISRIADSAAEELSDEEYDKFMNYYDDLEIQILQELPDDEEDDYEY